MAQIHRFHDAVACSLGDGSTCYLDPKTARKLAKALIAAAQSVERESFAVSNCSTVRLDIGEQGDIAGAVKTRKQVRKCP